MIFRGTPFWVLHRVLHGVGLHILSSPVHTRNFSLVSEMRSSGAKFKKQSKHGQTFAPIIAFGNS